MTTFTAPGLSIDDATTVADTLQERLSALNDLHLTLKHVHWNVLGANFIGVHEMIDPQVELVRGYADTIAERIATLGVSPRGTAKAIEDDRSWDDYSIGRDTAQAHLGALNLVYNGFITSHRAAIEKAGEIDPVTEDILIGQTAELEKFQWFVRAHLESYTGELATAGETTEVGAADAARAAG
ncbi:Dps family protein [Gordonia sp. NPDC003424]